MNQTKLQSFIESITNVAIGYLVALFSQIVIFPFYGISISITDNLMIGAWCYLTHVTFNDNGPWVETVDTFTSLEDAIAKAEAMESTN